MMHVCCNSHGMFIIYDIYDTYKKYNISGKFFELGVILHYPDGKVHGANIGPTWALSVPDGTHIGPMNLAIRVTIIISLQLMTS